LSKVTETENITVDDVYNYSHTYPQKCGLLVFQTLKFQISTFFE